MKCMVLVWFALAAAPVNGVEVARVRVATPVSSFMSGASAVGAVLPARIGTLTNTGLSGLTSAIPSKLAPPSLIPTAIPMAPQTEGYSAPVVAPQAVTEVPLSMLSALVPSGGVALSQQKPPVAAVKSLQGFVAQMEFSRVSGQDISNELSNRFFDQSGTRGPPLAMPAQTSVSDVATPKFPQGVKSVAVDMVRTAADVERLIPSGDNSNVLKAELKRDVSKMAPYQIYTYHDSRGGRFTGIDLSAKPAIVDQIPELQQHEVKLIKKLLLVDSDIRVLVREDGKTPDLVIGGKLVEMKSFAGMSLSLEELINKANNQVFEHGRRHGLGAGAVAVDMTREERVPVSLVQGILNSWQSGASEPVVLDQVIVFGQADMQVFVRKADGTYLPAAPAAAVRPIVNERPLASAEKGPAQVLLRNGIEKSPVLALSL